MRSTAICRREPGKDYKLLNPPQPASGNKIEVLEFFFYGCSHCFHLHPQMSAWEKTMPKDVELIYVPTIFRDSWEPMARTFYALEALGQLQQLHDALFKAWNVDNNDLSDEARILRFRRAARRGSHEIFSGLQLVFDAEQGGARQANDRSYGIPARPRWSWMANTSSPACNRQTPSACWMK